jgi:glycosyltransferase involved in cell wall biosynthesis
VSISVIVPVYNEQASIEMVIEEAVATLDEIGREYEILVIDDGSNDATGEIVDRMAHRYKRVTAIHHKENKGLGGVYRTAFANVKYDYVTILAGDGEVPACTIRTFMSSIDNVDVVLGFLPHGKFLPTGKPDVRSRLLSGAERVLYRTLFGTFPKFQGNLLFRRKLLEDLPLASTGRGWMIMSELLIRASRAGYKMVSVPIEMRPRIAGKSKVKNLRMSTIMFFQLLKLWGHLRWQG